MTINSINPSNETIIKTYELHNYDIILDKVKKGNNRYYSWRETDIDERIQLFRKLAQVLRDGKDEFATLMSTEMGKPISQARAEVEKCAWTCEVYSENIKEWIQEEEVFADGEKHRVVFQPLGVILAVMPWNFPFWQVFRFAIPTLLMGNCAILKHSNDVPGCALAIEKIFEKAGFPKNVFQTILSDHSSVEKLIGSKMIQGVSLTGSTQAGKNIAEIAGKYLKHVVLELGGSDPFVVFDDANLDKAVKAAVVGRTQNNGQSCIAAKRFFIQRDIVDQFVSKFGRVISELKIGDPLDSDTDIGPMANKKEYQAVLEQLEDAKSKGATIITGGDIQDQKGYFFPPTVLTDVSEEMDVISQEVFGPISPIMVFDNEEEVISMANNTEFGLGASVWTDDIEKGERIVRKLDAGSVFVNSIVKSDPRMPFGGIKNSGLGRELARWGLLEFVNIKGLNIYRV